MKSREWKGLINAENCCIIGPFKKISTDLDNDLLDTIIRTTQAGSLSDLRTFQRLTINDEKFYSKDYLRMKRRICYVVLLDSGEMVEIQYFIWNKNSDSVFACAKLLMLKDPFARSGHHLLRVQLTKDIKIVPVTKIK